MISKTVVDFNDRHTNEVSTNNSCKEYSVLSQDQQAVECKLQSQNYKETNEECGKSLYSLLQELTEEYKNTGSTRLNEINGTAFKHKVKHLISELENYQEQIPSEQTLEGILIRLAQQFPTEIRNIIGQEIIYTLTANKRNDSFFKRLIKMIVRNKAQEKFNNFKSKL